MEKKLTKAEEEIMQAVWALGRCSVGDIRDWLEANTKDLRPPHSTISTIVRIMDGKGFVGHETYGKTHVYYPLISKEDYSKNSLRELASGYFGGSFERLVSFIAKEENLDLKELTELLDKVKK